MKFELITKDNIMLATNIQLRIFKDENECAYLHYLNSFICNKDYYIVYKANEPVGITGLYIDEFTQEDDVVWLGWFGVLPEYRNKGLGCEILLKSLELAKDKGFKVLRLYTSKNNQSACNLYDKLMDFVEEYTRENITGGIVYSKSLISNISASKFSNQFLNLKWHDLEQKEGYKLYRQEINK